MKICWKKLSPRDRKFRWYKYDEEGLKRGETGFCEVGCGLGLPAPCAPRPSTLGGPAAPAAPENGRIGGLSAPLILRGEEAPLLPSPLHRFRTFFGVFLRSVFWKKISPKNRKFRSSRGSETRRKLDSVKCFVGLDSNFIGVFLDSFFFLRICR